MNTSYSDSKTAEQLERLESRPEVPIVLGTAEYERLKDVDPN